MEQKKVLDTAARIVLPLLLGGTILWWMYRQFDFGNIRHVLLDEMDWTWMWLSFPFGITAMLFRGWRWQQTLEPLGEKPRQSVSINAVFLSYAASLVIPRIGEFTRCGVLKRYDGVSFAKALGTVVTERAIDTLFILIITGLTIIFQLSVFGTFFERTGTNIGSILRQFSGTGYLVTAICGVAALILLRILLKRLSIYNKVKATLGGIWQGVISLKDVRHPWLFLAFTLAIWASYFLHFYLPFFCFPSTGSLGLSAVMVIFVVSSIAVVVPTPNGAGPWHFAVKTMLILYGIEDNQALYFVLILHGVQTLLIIALGLWALLALAFTKARNEEGGTRNEEGGTRKEEGE